MILAIVEIITRCLPVRFAIPYEEGPASYSSARVVAETLGAPEVVFVGSSRVQYGIVSDDMIAAIGAGSGERELRVGNFGLAAARLNVVGPLMQFLVHATPPPKCIVYGVTQDQMRDDIAFHALASVFFDTRSCLALDRDFNAGVVLPEALRNDVGRYWRTLAYRALPTIALRSWVRGWRTPNPQLGDAAVEHVLRGNEHFEVNEALAAEIAEHVANDLCIAGRYPVSEDAWAYFSRVVSEVVRTGVVCIVVEMPNAEIFDRALPAGSRGLFEERMRRVCEELGIRHIALDELAVEFEVRDFRDPVHLNLRGAKRFTGALGAILNTEPSAAARQSHR